jgi:hypothetical protein
VNIVREVEVDVHVILRVDELLIQIRLASYLRRSEQDIENKTKPNVNILRLVKLNVNILRLQRERRR